MSVETDRVIHRSTGDGATVERYQPIMGAKSRYKLSKIPRI